MSVLLENISDCSVRELTDCSIRVYRSLKQTSSGLCKSFPKDKTSFWVLQQNESQYYAGMKFTPFIKDSCSLYTIMG